jgi:hypothetical protein
MAIVTEKQIEKARNNFLKALPQRLTCPHCKQNRKKENFGVRLVNRPEVEKGKAKPQFFRQSHCNTCRG